MTIHADGRDCWKWLESAVMARFEDRQMLLSIQVVDTETVRIALAEPHPCGTCGQPTKHGTVTREGLTGPTRYQCWACY